MGEEGEDCTDDVSSGAGATSPAASPRPDRDDDSTQGSAGAAPLSATGSHLWPSMQDLNTRLRRLITAYQRNYKREELKMQQKAKVGINLFYDYIFRLFPKMFDFTKFISCMYVMLVKTEATLIDQQFCLEDGAARADGSVGSR